MDAYQLVSQTALTPIANVVDTNYTVVAKVAKRFLRGAHGNGRHARPAAHPGALQGLNRRGAGTPSSGRSTRAGLAGSTIAASSTRS